MGLAPRSIDELRLWQRVHVRLTVIYGSALLLVLTPAAYFVYQLAVEAELDNLFARIHVASVGLAELIDGDRLVAIRAPDDPYRLELLARLERFRAQSPEVASVYVFLPTDQPEILTFVVDVDTRAAPGQLGQVYDATAYPLLRGGLDRPALERVAVADAWGESVSGFAPIFDGRRRPVAILGIDVNASRLADMEARLLKIAVSTYLGALVLLGLAAVGVAHIVRRPMASVIGGTEAIARGELEARVGLARADDFGVLGRNFDIMAAGLEEREHIRQTFGRYVSEDVARKLLADRKSGVVRGEERFVTVLFTDLRGYSTLSSHLDPSQILALMNEYLEGVSAVIVQHGGVIIEYLGDGVLTVFGAPDDLPDHATEAVRCAIAMQARLDAMNAAWDANGRSALWKPWGIERLTTKTGIHCGPVVAGSLGSQVRMKYAILGDAVNLAARLESLNAALGTSTLVTRDVRDRLPPDLAARCVSRGGHLVKGRSEPVEVFELT